MIMDVYIDESIHTRGNFIVLAAVCATKDNIEKAEKALGDCGFVAGRDEFKSSMKMSGNASAQKLRDRFQGILSECKIAVGICPVNERSNLMQLASALCETIAANGDLVDSTIYLDQGMTPQAVTIPPGWKMISGCDSKTVIGIQLADCSAHFISTMLLGELGLFNKMVPAGRVYPGDDGELELAWELWASIRYALASSLPINEDSDDGMFEPTRKPYGLVLSKNCDPAVTQAARHRLGTSWVGCIH